MSGCKFEGCDGKHYGNGYCHAHSQQLRRGQELRPVLIKADSLTRCAFPGCDGKHHSSGFCGGHYAQYSKGKELKPLRKPGGTMCSFDECKNKATSHGLCPAHARQKKNGQELRPLKKQFHGLTEKERFMKWVTVPENMTGCWAWLGSSLKSSGHGQWRSAAGKPELAHRAAWRLLKGPIPDGMCVLHRCDNPFCVNPAHLFIGTQSDNALDMWNKGRANPGVSRGEAHGMSIFKEDQIRAIRASTKSGPALAKEFNCSTTTIYDIKNFKIWKEVK